MIQSTEFVVGAPDIPGCFKGICLVQRKAVVDRDYSHVSELRLNNATSLQLAYLLALAVDGLFMRRTSVSAKGTGEARQALAKKARSSSD